MLDLPTFAVFLASIVCLLLAMQWGGVTQYSWGNAHVFVLFIVFGLLTGSFATLEIRRKDKALVPLNIISQRSIAISIVFSLCTSGAGSIPENLRKLVPYNPEALHLTFGNGYQSGFKAAKSLSVIDLAVRLLPIVISAIICTIASGILVPIAGYYVPSMLLAILVWALGLGFVTALQFDSPIQYVLY